MSESYFGFDTGQLFIGLIKLMKSKGLLDEEEVLQLLWDAKDPMFPWSKNEIKELLNL